MITSEDLPSSAPRRTRLVMGVVAGVLILIEINIDGTDCIMAVPVEYEPTFKPLKPKDLFKSEKYILPSVTLVSIQWDIGRDGRFPMMKPAASACEQAAVPAPSKIIVVTNWFEKIKERVSEK